MYLLVYFYFYSKKPRYLLPKFVMSTWLLISALSSALHTEIADENIVGHMGLVGNNDQTAGLLNVEFVGMFCIV